MKKFFVGTVTACLLLTGCGDDKPEVKKPTVDKTPEVVQHESSPVRREVSDQSSDTPTNVYMNRLTANYDKRNYREAVSDADEVIRTDPTNIDARIYRGYAYSTLGNYRAAVADFTKVLELDPKNLDAYFGRGVALANLGDYNNAVADFDKLIALNPLDVDNYESRGMIYGNMGKFDKALADFDTVIELRPTVEAYQQRAKCHEALGNNDKAQADLAKARELSQ